MRFNQVYYKVGATREPTLQIITDLKGTKQNKAVKEICGGLL